MWPKWLNSRRRRHVSATSPPSSPSPLSRPRSRSNRFSYSSFKDIDALLQFEPESPKSPTLFRNLSISPSVVRSFTITTTTTTTARTVPSSLCPITSPPKTGAIVFYFTSLHVIRRTFEDCRVVRSILLGLGVAIDERDVSIDEKFRDELRESLGRWNVTLPSVFIGGNYVGGADDIKRLYNSGELQGLIEQFPKSKTNGGCDLCGGMRFVVCDVCDGSHKVFAEKSGFRIRSCAKCNVNGLIRCPACFFVLPHTT
ncbi:hypothetical protein RIF29_08821 [Crotalaria pallida]|uniref:Glutaredoxin domain-containing protein n=1 Tax=Crotalaria pallida TaxID=3830 RepID=A0AAN9FR61_CROPI